VYGLANGNVNVTRRQNDGKILVGGFFTEANGYAATGVARLNPDGSVDRSFNGPEFYGGFGLGYQIFSLCIQPDGKILVGGNFYGINPVFNPGVRRLNSDGTLDSTFTVAAITQGDTVYDLELQSDGKILVGSTAGLRRLNADGTLDGTFGPVSGVIGVVSDIVVQADGKIVSVGSVVRRFTSDGASDPSFTQPFGISSVEALAILPTGQYLIVGSFTNVNNFPQGRIAVINADGSVDLTFNQNNPGSSGTINDVIIRPNGKTLIGGSFSLTIRQTSEHSPN